MELNVGDYVITKDRLHIGKIYNINEFREPNMMYAIDFPNTDDFIFMGENDFKSSPNIIDLIEVGDFITYKKGNMYIGIPYRVYGTYNEILEETELRIDDEYLKDIEILSIVTKEQFEAMKYVVGEE